MKKYLDIDGAKYLAQGIIDKVKTGSNAEDQLPINTVLTSYAGNIFGDDYISGIESVSMSECNPRFINRLNVNERCSESNSNLKSYPGLTWDGSSFWMYDNTGSSYDFLTRVRSYKDSDGRPSIESGLVRLRDVGSDNIEITDTYNIFKFGNYIYMIGYQGLFRHPNNTFSEVTEIVTPPPSYDTSYRYISGATDDKIIYITPGKTYYTTSKTTSPTYSYVSNNLTSADFYSSLSPYNRLYNMGDGYLIFFTRKGSNSYINRMNINTLVIDSNFTYLFSSISTMAGSLALNAFYDNNTDSYIYTDGFYIYRYIKQTNEHIIISPQISNLVEFYYTNNTIIYSYQNGSYYEIATFKVNEFGYYTDSVRTLSSIDPYIKYNPGFFVDEINNILITVRIANGSDNYSYAWNLTASPLTGNSYEYTKYK